MSDVTAPAFEQWGILELMGHIRLAGLVSEESRFGSTVGRIDVPEGEDQPAFTHYFGGSALFRFTPTTEETARTIAGQIGARPVPLYELRQPQLLESRRADPDDDEFEF